MKPTHLRQQEHAKTLRRWALRLVRLVDVGHRDGSQIPRSCEKFGASTVPAVVARRTSWLYVAMDGVFGCVWMCLVIQFRCHHDSHYRTGSSSFLPSSCRGCWLVAGPMVSEISIPIWDLGILHCQLKLPGADLKLELVMKLIVQTNATRSHTCTRNTHTHTHTHIHTYIPTHIPTYLPTYLHAYIDRYMHIHTHSFIHSFVRSFVHWFIHSFIHSFIHPSIHTYIHTSYMFIYAYVSVLYYHILIERTQEVKDLSNGHLDNGEINSGCSLRPPDLPEAKWAVGCQVVEFVWCWISTD